VISFPIVIVIDRGRFRRWHAWLADGLRAAGCQDIKFVSVSSPMITASLVPCEALIRAEKAIFRLSGEHAIDPLSPSNSKYPHLNQRPEPIGRSIAINLSSKELPEGQPDARILTPLVDGLRGEVPLFARLLQLRAIELSLADTAFPNHVWKAWPAVEQPRQITKSLDNVLSRLAELILKAVNDTGAGPQMAFQSSRTAPEELGSFALPLAALEFVANSVRAKASARLTKVRSRDRRWAIAARPWNGKNISTTAKSQDAFKIRPNRPESWYADPFVFVENDKTYVFCEEFSLATQKGTIAVSLAEPDGSLSEPCVILEEDFHLSYPFVFRHEGKIWMLPEAAQSDRVILYEAVQFPYKWARHQTLISDCKFYDPTLIRHDGSFWMLLTTTRWESSSWDNLEVYRADDMKGPWHPASQRPCLIDRRAARSAGATWFEDGQLIRPAQDCSVSYGGGLVICRVDKLDLSGYGQTAIGAVTASSGSKNFGIHTLNSVGALQVIDVFGEVEDVSSVSLSWA
jgi:hypothetical protein